MDYIQGYSHVYGTDRDIQELLLVWLEDCATIDKQILD
jgi:hypothetical protein